MRSAVETLDRWTTGQLLAEVLKRSAGDAPALRLLQGMRETGGPPLATIDEQAPPELNQRARRVLNDLDGNDFSMAFLNLAQLHRALATLMPDSIARPRAAYAATAFEHHRDDEEDWQRFFP